MNHRESIDAIRAVRLAAHELSNACATIVGGTEMALSLPTVETIGQSLRGFKRKPGKRQLGGE
ncbi:hypothetical protein [Sphingobium sp. YR768]|uniref:hypothetical protein n=1 Tax=Sphingobium sp. YR768 TaxID=1884365 RepID=UPI0008B8F925|nr:hypothetical protein [Sphingobium sp. YR768]SES19785.1 hypothetical protein SAMN05518866_1609 [Sphingobium sp. YR768]